MKKTMSREPKKCYRNGLTSLLSHAHESMRQVEHHLTHILTIYICNLYIYQSGFCYAVLF